MALHRQKFMNSYIDNVTREEALKHIEECIENRTIGHVITPNVDQIVRIETDSYFKQIVENAELLLVDGTPLVWIAKLYRRPFKEKICGSDLFPDLCELAVRKKYSIFLLGAAEGVADKAACNIIEKYPKIKIAGTYSPPYGFEKNQNEIDKINNILLNSKADMLIVGLGVPKQDIFIYENMKKYQIPLSFSFGAVIDFEAGVQKRAPKWINRIGMEWLYRLLDNPSRMFKRYIIDDMKIFRLAWKYRNEK